MKQINKVIIHSCKEKVKATLENTSLNEEESPVEELGTGWSGRGHRPAMGQAWQENRWQEGSKQGAEWWAKVK